MRDERATAGQATRTISSDAPRPAIAALVNELRLRLDHIDESALRVNAFKARFLDPRPESVREGAASIAKEPSDSLESSLRTLINRAQRIADYLAGVCDSLDSGL